MSRWLGLVVLLFLVLPARAQAPVGVPCGDKGWYARQIWDMQVYHGFLYIGCGNSSNVAPSPNAGPIDLWRYSARTGWVSETTIEEEQIDRLLVIGGRLVIPGHDGTGDDWSLGSIYVRGFGATWEMLRTIPYGVHVYDLIAREGKLIAALGTNRTDGIAISTDGGTTWATQRTPADSELVGDPKCPTSYRLAATRVYSLFTVGDTLYANTAPGVVGRCVGGVYSFEVTGETILVWDGEGFALSAAPLYGRWSDQADRIVRAVVYRGETVYIAARTVNDHQWSPLGALRSDGGYPRNVEIKDCARPQDFDVRNGVLYALCNEPTTGGWRVSVQASCDARHWVAVAAFEAHAFGRSLAVSGRDVYVGMGVDTDATATARAESGQVQRITLPFVMGCR